MNHYVPLEIEKKWQLFWHQEKTFATDEDKEKPKYFLMIEFPYPSGDGLHVGHPRSYTALDIVARKRRLQGYNVLYPIGWDAFGLPTENFAIKHKIHPKVVTENNIKRFKQQLMSLGMSFDWSREINTTDPNYYMWTQWIFLKLFEKGLAYKKEMPVNWCLSCKVGLANEEVVNGLCERCDGVVERRMKNQWMLRITDYAQRLIDDLQLVDYIERVKIQQKNWIGESEGLEVSFHIKGTNYGLTVFTTRPDTIFGVTYMVIAPEHPLIDKMKNSIENMEDIKRYQQEALKKSDFQRAELSDNKTGVELKGIKAINPVEGGEIPIFISDYVLMTYGTGAVMAVPGHDKRDWEFAQKYNLPVVRVIDGENIDSEPYEEKVGKLINSKFLNGLEVREAIELICSRAEAENFGRRKTTYKLRDWVFSRQRYWGEPIPLVYCQSCGWVPLPYDQLPLVLPQVEEYEPTETGESPLAKITEWVETTCPTCGEGAKRETDTMPQWAGSSWYFLRYTDPHNNHELASKEALDYWLPVDWYNGGMEHTTLHLLYSRFWHKFLYDLGIVSMPEPYQKRTSHGMILAENNEKMSKSRGNVVNPDGIVEEFGADTFRVYEMFIGDFEKSVSWSQNGLKGCRRFLDRVWRLQDITTEMEEVSKDLERKIHQTIKKVSEDYETLKFNTGIASLMALINDFYNIGYISKGDLKVFLLLLNPAAPHITEEIWRRMEFEGFLHQQKWPLWKEDILTEEEVEVVIQFNGKYKDKLKVNKNIVEEDLIEIITNHHHMKEMFANKSIVKTIYVQGKILNFVVK